MKNFAFIGGKKISALVGIIALIFTFPGLQAHEGLPHHRIVSLGGPITEIIYALGQGDQLVGVDTSSVYPKSVTQLPKVGYQRSLSAEGVLSLNPGLILASAEAGPPAVVKQLKQSGVPWVTIPGEDSLDGAKAKIRAVAQALHCEREGEILVRRLEEEMVEVQNMLASKNLKPRVLFLYARGAGTLQAAGQNTAADAMIQLAGGINAVTGYVGYKPLTAEAVVSAMPDVILIPGQGLESIGGMESLLAQPALAQTPAGKARHIVTMEDLLLLGFGPRLGEALRQLIPIL